MAGKGGRMRKKREVFKGEEAENNPELVRFAAKSSDVGYIPRSYDRNILADCNAQLSNPSKNGLRVDYQ